MDSITSHALLVSMFLILKLIFLCCWVPIKLPCQFLIFKPLRNLLLGFSFLFCVPTYSSCCCFFSFAWNWTICNISTYRNFWVSLIAMGRSRGNFHSADEDPTQRYFLILSFSFPLTWYSWVMCLFGWLLLFLFLLPVWRIWLVCSFWAGEKRMQNSYDIKFSRRRGVGVKCFYL